MNKGLLKWIISDTSFIDDPKNFYLHVIPFLMNHKNSVVEYHLIDYYCPSYLKNLKDIKNADGSPFFDIETESESYREEEILILRIK